MTVPVSLAAYGRVIRFELASADLEPLVTEHLPPGYTIVDGAAVADRVWRVDRAHAGDLRQVWSDVELWVADQAVAMVFVHAACVAVDGRALLLPGRSMAGKSSLAAALVRAGAAYYSDEYALLDPAGRVWPYPRDLSVREAGSAHRFPPAHFGGTAATEAATVGLVALLRYEVGGAWAVEPIAASAGVLGLLDNTVSARSQPGAALTATAAAARGASFLRGVRGEADEAAARLLDALG